MATPVTIADFRTDNEDAFLWMLAAQNLESHGEHEAAAGAMEQAYKAAGVQHPEAKRIYKKIVG